MDKKKNSNDSQMASEYDLMKYRLANDALGIALWDMDVTVEDPVSPENRVTWSGELRNMLGFSDEGDFPDTISALADRFHPDDSDMAFAAFAAHFNDRTGKTPYNIEYRLKHKNGEYRWFHGFGTTQRDSEGIPHRVAGAVMDITKLKEAEALKQTREINARIKIIFDTAPIACLMFDKDFKIFDCNLETVKMFGLEDKQIFLESFFRFSPECQPCGRSSREMAVEHNRKTLTRGYNRFEWVHQTLSGEAMPCEVTLVLVNYKDEHVVACYIRDLREHNALLDEIHNEKDRYKTMAHWYESLLDAMPFLVSAQDENKNWTFINKALETALGKKREDVIDIPCKTWGLSMCDTDECAIDCARRGQMRTYFSRKDTSYQVDIKLLENLAGVNSGYIEIIQDITQIESMIKQQSEIEIADSAKSAFISTMSHEMRTPMNAIMGMTTIGKIAQTLDRKNYALNKIEEASRQLLGLINDVLDMTNIEANRLELSNTIFDIRNPIQKALFFTKSSLKEKNLRLLIDLPDTLPFFFVGDEQRLTQVLTNLLANAVKFSPEEGKINLSVSLAGEEGETSELLFEVADSGIGISPEQHEKIFLAFEQVEKGITRKYGGTGIGLFITKRIVELMGGRIWVESELGKGAAFFFTIKLLRNRDDVSTL